MSHSANAGHSVADIYKSVISDVIAQVKEAFLDENVDIDILNQLKKEWEEKVAQSGCVDMEQRPAAASMRAVQNAAQSRGGHAPSQGGVRIQPSTQQMLANQHHLQQMQQIEQSQAVHVQMQAQQVVQQPRPVYLQGHPGMQQLHGLPLQSMQQAGQAAVYPHLRPLTHAVHQGYPVMQANQLGQLVPNSVMVLSGGQQFPVSLGGAAILQGQPRLQMQGEQQHDHLHQLDGNCGEEGEAAAEEKKGEPNKAEAHKILKKLMKAMQLDGNGMSDSSSDEEEEDEEEDDPLRRMANRIGDASTEDGEGLNGEEDPLNSGDDQSDDEDLDTLFDADNVVMCQFEKVHRARSKWKFLLKDGIMHINGRDFCFQKCTGEAEW